MNAGAQDGIRDEQSVRMLVRELILELAPNQTYKDLTSDSRLVEDLEFHSLALMEMAFTLEDEFSLDPISEQDALKIISAGDVEQYVVDELRRKEQL